PEPGERPQFLDAPLYEDKKGKWIMSIELINGGTYLFRLETKEEMRSIKRAILKDIEGNNSKSLAFKNTIILIDKILSIDFKEE
ncbi:MAG: hypothetical protein KAS32_14295, partial [Candidatus Peribacteraceae bacterium]|nr:hypothetical protein [Candidatus Peribacteraceae bacterium]